MFRPFAGLLRPEVSDEASSHQIGQRIAEGGAQRRAEADEEQGDGELVQESEQNRQEQRSGNGECL